MCTIWTRTRLMRLCYRSCIWLVPRSNLDVHARHDVVPQQKIASRFMNPIFPVQTSRNRTPINMGGSNNANMWSTHTSTTTSMALEARSAPHHVVTKSSSINRRSAEQTPEYYNTVHVTQVRHTWIPVCAQRDKTQHPAYRKTHAM